MYIRDNNGSIKRWDFYGGNLRGVIEKLDYIKSFRCKYYIHESNL